MASRSFWRPTEAASICAMMWTKAESMIKCGAHFIMLSVMREMEQIADTLEKLISLRSKSLDA